MPKKKIGYYQRQFKIAREAWAKYSPARKECFNLARVKIEDGVYKWRCAKCPNLFALSEVQCDHVEPISKTVPTSAEEYTQLFLKLESPKLQILCKKHHNEKTKTEIGTKQKEIYIENILFWFKSMSVFRHEMLNQDLNKLKRISTIVTGFMNGSLTENDKRKKSKQLHDFLEGFEKHEGIHKD